MDKISFEHGGPEYDVKYPEGIPTSLHIVDSTNAVFDRSFTLFSSLLLFDLHLPFQS